MFIAEIRRNRANQTGACSNWQWHLEEVFVKINGKRQYLLQAGELVRQNWTAC